MATYSTPQTSASDGQVSPSGSDFTLYSDEAASDEDGYDKVKTVTSEYQPLTHQPKNPDPELNPVQSVIHSMISYQYLRLCFRYIFAGAV